MAVVPIYNPPVPYLGYIDGGFGPGRMVRIQGVSSSSAQRFAINLQCGPNTNPRDDIALHLSPRFNDNFITRSCLQNQSWTGEENHGSMPLSRGQPFEIIILCDPAHYKIAVNGQHFTEYIHRIPFSRVTHLTIDGDVTLNVISFEGGYAPPPIAGNGAPGFSAVPPTMPGMMPSVPAAPSYPPGGDMGYPKQGGMPYVPPGPVPPYGAPPMYGGYQPPPGPQAYGGYGGYGGYGQPPPPPGYQPGKSGGGGFLDKAGMAIAGALGGAGVMGAIGGKYPTLPQGHGDSGQGSMGTGSVGGLGTLGTLIGTGLAGAALSGVLGGKENPASSTNPDNKPKNPSHNTPTTQGDSSHGTSSSGGLGYLGNLISPGLAGAIQAGLMGGPDRNAPAVHDRKYPNPYPQADPAASSGGALGSLGSLIGSGLAGAIQSGIMGGGANQNPYDRRSPGPYGYGGQGNYGSHGNYGGQNPYGGGNQSNYGGGQSGGLGSLGNLIGSGLAGAFQSGILGGKEKSNQAALSYATKDEKKVDKSGGKIDEDLIRSLDELIVGPDDKPLNKSVIKLSDQAPIKSSDKSQVESEIEPKIEPDDKAKAMPDNEPKKEADDDNAILSSIEELIVKNVDEPVTKSVQEPTRKTVEEVIEEPVIKPSYVPEKL